MRRTVVTTLGFALMGLASCGFASPRRGARGSWPQSLPAILNTSSREQILLPNGAQVLFLRHRGPFESSFAGLTRDLVAGGWQVLDVKGNVFSQAMAGCGQSCDDVRFYAVTRRVGPVSETLLRISSPAEHGPPLELTGPCTPVAVARPELDAASRYAPIYDVDLDRDGRLDAYVPRAEGEDVVWDAYVMRGACGVRVGTFTRLPADPHTTAMGDSGLVDLTMAETIVDEDGRNRQIPITFRFDGTRYVRPEATPP